MNFHHQPLRTNTNNARGKIGITKIFFSFSATFLQLLIFCIPVNKFVLFSNYFTSTAADKIFAIVIVRQAALSWIYRDLSAHFSHFSSSLGFLNTFWAISRHYSWRSWLVLQWLLIHWIFKRMQRNIEQSIQLRLCFYWSTWISSQLEPNFFIG